MALLTGSSQAAFRTPRKWLCGLAILLALSLPAQNPGVEYRIKAAYLFNFAKFVSWPSDAFVAADSPIVIGILGKDPFGAELDQTVAGKNIEGRVLRIKRLDERDSLEGCHILFIGDSERRRLPQILQNLSSLPILTVGEMEEFTEGGGMIKFFKYENTIRFEIDLEPVKRARLKISSKALQVAIVKGKPEK